MSAISPGSTPRSPRSRPPSLAEGGLVRRGVALVKVLGGGELTRALKVTASKFSETAKAKIEKAGGQAVVG